MNVRQLKRLLEGVPDFMDVYIKKSDEDFEFSLVEKAELQEINMHELNHDEGPKSTETNFVITDEA